MSANNHRDQGFGDWPIPQPLLTEIGRIAQLWAVLEDLLNFTLGRVYGLDPQDPRQFVLTQHLSVPQRIDMLGALATMDENSTIDSQQLSMALEKLRHAQTERNRLLHIPVIPDEKTGEYFIMQSSARGRVKITTDPVSVESLRNVVLLIHDAMQSLSKAIYGGEVPPQSKEEA